MSPTTRHLGGSLPDVERLVMTLAQASSAAWHTLAYTFTPEGGAPGVVQLDARSGAASVITPSPSDGDGRYGERAVWEMNRMYAAHHGEIAEYPAAFESRFV